jgi:two-component system heavy metal sensor histidine kinase CusS
MPFRLKIALFSACISGLVLVAFGLTAWLLVSRQRLASVDTEIRSLGARHPGWIASHGNYQRLDDALQFIFGETHENQIILLVKDTNNVVLHTSSGWPKELDPARIDGTLADDPTAVTLGGGMGRGRGGMGRGFGPGGGMGQVTFTKIPRFQTVQTADTEWRLGMLGTADTTLVIGLNLAGPHAELNRLRNAFLIALPVALFLVGLGGWLVAGRALRPMRAIADTAERVTASGLDQRIPTSNEDPEIARVILVLNRMMDRLEASFRQATRFSADASHELKTPLAIMQGELENALQSAAPGSKEQQTFSALLEETQRLKTITRSLLLLAQADAGRLVLTRETVNLATTLQSLIEDAKILAEDARLNFEVEIPADVIVQADRALLHTALLNLLVNAVKYNEPSGRIRVELAGNASTATLTVGNTGPGIAAEEQAKIFDRFHRVEAARSRNVDGIGLGLSLAREIVRAHGGDLTLKESRPSWTVFQLQLPQPTK